MHKEVIISHWQQVTCSKLNRTSPNSCGFFLPPAPCNTPLARIPGRSLALRTPKFSPRGGGGRGRGLGRWAGGSAAPAPLRQRPPGPGPGWRPALPGAAPRSLRLLRPSSHLQPCPPRGPSAEHPPTGRKTPPSPSPRLAYLEKLRDLPAGQILLGLAGAHSAGRGRGRRRGGWAARAPRWARRGGAMREPRRGSAGGRAEGGRQEGGSRPPPRARCTERATQSTFSPGGERERAQAAGESFGGCPR